MKRQKCVTVNSAVMPMNHPPNVEDIMATGKNKVKKEGEHTMRKSVVEEEERKESSKDMVGGFLPQE